MNTGVFIQVSESLFLIILDKYRGVELLSHMATLYLPFWRPTRLFSKVAASFYISTSSVQGSNLSTSSAALVIFVVLLIAPRAGMKNYLTEGLWLVFLQWLLMISIFSCTNGHLWSSCGEMPSQVLLPIVWVCYWGIYSSYIVEIKPLSGMIFKYFLPFRKLSFHFLHNVLWYTNVFNFNKIQFTYF